MVKSIIKRIIAGIGIMLAWYFIDTNFIMVVHAESVNVIPDKLCAINATGGACNFSSPNTYQVSERPVYGNAFGADSSRSRVIWHFTGNNLKDKTYDVNFLIYIQGSTTHIQSARGYIGNGADNIFSCTIDNTRWGSFFTGANSSVTSSNAGADGSAMVHCNNVYLNENYFNFYLLEINTRANGVIAISHATLTESVTAKQTKELEEVNDNITDSSVDTGKADSDINDMKNKVSSNGSITQLLTLPITLYQSILNSASGSCSGSFDLGTLLGHHLELPCIQPQRYLGNSIWTIIDMLCSGLFILSFRKKMVDIFNHMTSLNDRGNELE